MIFKLQLLGNGTCYEDVIMTNKR